ncbi:hypothetical protein A3765_16355 [Oleiphilus sp. HI0130]|nr:hypothetical protein A3765_16355 [Oleiphilus sp. HI0130]
MLHFTKYNFVTNLISLQLTTDSMNSRLNLTSSNRKIGIFLLMGFIAFYYVRPQELLTFLSPLRLSGVIAWSLSIWGLFHFRPEILKSQLKLIFIIGFLCLFSGLYAVNVTSYKLGFQFLLQYFPIATAIFLLIDSKEQVLKFFNYWCWIHFFVALITLKNGGLGPGDFTRDPNDAALALSMSLPFLYYAPRFLALSKRQSIIRYFMLFVVISAVISTNSRGGFLGLCSVLLTIWLFSDKKFKYIKWIIAVSIVSSSLTSLLIPEGYIAEVQSINDSEDNTRVERLRTWEIAWLMYLDNPILGVGAGNFPWNVSRYQPETSWALESDAKSLSGRKAHSTYFQILADLGTIGGLTFFFIIFRLPYTLLQKIKTSHTQENMTNLAKALVASMAAYAVSGAFISVAYYPHLTLFVAFYAIIWRELLKAEIQETSKDQTFQASRDI